MLPPPSRFLDLPLSLVRDLAKKKKAVGCLSSKKYSNHNYTHTLESSCLCQVAEINVALRGERAARACKGAKEFLTTAKGKSCLLENMKHIGLFMLVSFIPTKCWFYDKTEQIWYFCGDRFGNLLLQDDLINYVIRMTYVHLDCNTSVLVVILGSLNWLTGIVEPTLSKEECSLFLYED